MSRRSRRDCSPIPLPSQPAKVAARIALIGGSGQKRDACPYVDVFASVANCSGILLPQHDDLQQRSGGTPIGVARTGARGSSGLPDGDRGAFWAARGAGRLFKDMPERRPDHAKCGEHLIRDIIPPAPRFTRRHPGPVPRRSIAHRVAGWLATDGRPHWMQRPLKCAANRCSG